MKYAVIILAGWLFVDAMIAGFKLIKLLIMPWVGERPKPTAGRDRNAVHADARMHIAGSNPAPPAKLLVFPKEERR